MCDARPVAAGPEPLLAGRDRPLRVAVLVSATGANLRTLCRLQAEQEHLLRVVLVASDRPGTPALDVGRRHGVPVWPGDFEAECGVWRECRTDGDRQRYRRRARAFHDRLAARMQRFGARHGEIDLVVLAYHRWIHGTFLEAFHQRVVNQHPGDLTVRTASSGRALVGMDPVGLALRSGAVTTRTSTFLVDDTHDGGPVLALGPPVAYPGPWPPSAADVQAQERRQKRLSDRPALRAAVTALAAGRLGVDPTARHDDGSAVIRLDGHPTAPGGLRLDADGGAPVGRP